MYRIMLADDEGIVIEGLKFMIENHFKGKCEIQSAKTGRSVIELAEQFRPEIAFMDIQMPGINGIDAMKEIRKDNPYIIFLVISAYDKFDYAKEAINLDVLEYLNKPLDQRKVVQALQKAMDRIDEAKKRRSNDLRIKEKLESVQPVVENSFIYSILFQNKYADEVENYRRLLSITCEYGFMMTIVLGEEQEGGRLTNAFGTGIRVQNRYPELRETCKDYFHGFVGPLMTNKIVMFVPEEKVEQEYTKRADLIEKARELARKIRTKFDLKVRIGIGSVVFIGEALGSYNEACNALINTRGSVAHVKDLPIGCNYEKDYPVENEQAIFRAVEAGNSQESMEQACRFFDWMLETHPEDETDIRLKVVEFVLFAEHSAYQNGGMTYHFTSRKEYLPTITQCSMKELRSWFVEKIVNASRNVRLKQEESQVSTIERAKAYINQQYTKDISLDDVSREVDISPYYFSKLFKEETGVNFIEYVTAIRICRAKQLLRTTDYSMKEICGQIGYTDPNYFSRIFKKTVGQTPTEFKESW